MKGDFVPHRLLHRTRTTQRSGVTHSLCTSAVTPTWVFFLFFSPTAAPVGNDVSPLTMKAFEKQLRPARRDGGAGGKKETSEPSPQVFGSNTPPPRPPMHVY